MGLGSPEMSDPDSRRTYFEAFRTAWEEVSVKLGDEAADISDLNRRTLLALDSVLVEETARELRVDYYNRALAAVRRTGGSHRRSLFRRSV